jgi:hypothetical protein
MALGSPGAGVGRGHERVLVRRRVDGVRDPGVPEGFDVAAVEGGLLVSLACLLLSLSMRIFGAVPRWFNVYG